MTVVTILLPLVFVIGYTLIALEHPLRLNKSATALVLGCLLWTLTVILGPSGESLSIHLTEHVAEIAALVFYLLGAMTIVEVIDAHDGFDVIRSRITTTSVRSLLWISSVITFLLSAILDNLTTTIVMITLTQKLIEKKEDRLVFAGMIVIAANAGGAFSPIGDVTTTMLWIGGRISSLNIIRKLFFPSVMNMLAPLAILSFFVKGRSAPSSERHEEIPIPRWQRKLVFFLGVGLLIAVPIFNLITGIPPYLGILFALGILWTTTEILHRYKHPEEKKRMSLAHALLSIDHPSILFFVGILLAVAALQVSGVLGVAAADLETRLPNHTLFVFLLGFLSSIVDNVPLVSAMMNMYPLTSFPMDHFIWEFTAYCAGTGGSLLIIGSAAGVTAMGLSGIPFGWYVRRISLLGLIGYLAGAGIYLGQNLLLHV
jgi:Na+/H+ antiporter NhaD/arsenite permease-like protein